MQGDIATQVRQIIAEQALLDFGDVSADMTLEEVGLDSLGLVEAIFAIEEAFDIKVPFNANAPNADGFDISTVASVIAGVEALVAGRT